MSATRIDVDGIRLIISLFFASFLVLLVSSFYILSADIELKLISDVSERFAEDELQFSINFDGRDGVIRGTVATEKEKREVIAIAESIEGVRVIKSELTIVDSSRSPSSNVLNSSSEISGITGISEGNIIDQSLDDISSITSVSASDLNKNIEKNNIPENLEKNLAEEYLLAFESDLIEFPLEYTSSLDSVAIKLKNDPLLLVEISSSHPESKIAIKRANIIKKFFSDKGIDGKHFFVIWDSSKNKNLVRLRLLQKNKREAL